MMVITLIIAVIMIIMDGDFGGLENDEDDGMVMVIIIWRLWL